MAIPKIYKCCICHKVLDSKPHRLVHQVWYDKYNNKHIYRYRNKHNFDFCDKCFNHFACWIVKHKEGTNEKSNM